MKTILTASASALALLLALPVAARPPWAGPEGVDLRIEQMADRLDLTETQQEELRAIFEARAEARRAARAAVEAQIDAVLTEEQRGLRDAQRERRIERQAARLAERLDLSAEQEAEIKTLMQAAGASALGGPAAMREQVASVLTEGQLEALDEMRGRRRGGGCR
jgi:Spy/CpxP family protein refolding chaperone